MSLQDFMHAYEMESLQLGTTARKDVIARMVAFFPVYEDDGLGSSFQETSLALAARRAAEESKHTDKEKKEGAALVIAGNSREGFHHRLRNIQLVALANAMHKCHVPGLVALDLRYNHLGEHDVPTFEPDDYSADQDADQDVEGTPRDEREFVLDTASSLGRLLQPTATYVCEIAELNLQGNRFGSESCRLLCTALDAAGTTSPLRRLNLNGNPLGPAGGHAIAALLASGACRLEELDIGNTELDASNLIAISQALRTNKTLKSLNLDNPVNRTKEEEAIQYIGKMLQVNRALTRLSLSKHQLTDNGAQVLAERLLDNRTLRRLVLRANRIGSTGASALAALLLRHSTLAEFDISANRIGDVGAKAFALVLRANMISPLEVLSLCSTSLTDEGVAMLASACLKPQNPEEGCRLRCLLLWGNVFGPKASPLLLELCDAGGRFHHYGVETDFLPRQVDDEVLVAHQETAHFPLFSSSKK
ncbi:RNA-DNA hybrid ribonuclease [Phytophthora boehmeriae]|uniref:RNA-DNA hybrid ribonuclease n=1 Tax=Phytophthora boehmeriae TaxID=109152 RepID=A0A8T1X309_9STRA|nr:RNA-DNA hybrid ribonuclease [Phytophthora boehmeriae]